MGVNGSIIDLPQWQPVKEESPIDLHKNKNVYQVSYDQKTVFLDILKSRSSYALTGLRFQKIGNNLRLEAQMTSFDYETGKLRRKNKWLANYNDIQTRYKISQMFFLLILE